MELRQDQSFKQMQKKAMKAAIVVSFWLLSPKASFLPSACAEQGAEGGATAVSTETAPSEPEQAVKKIVKKKSTPKKKNQETKSSMKNQAIFETSLGEIQVQLFPERAPKTVENFIQLATGKKSWTTPAGQSVEKPLYDGTKFHRVIPNFMIQGGDPRGDGTGGPGYRFADEFHPGHEELDAFDEVGILAMANAGPNTNGSQFFITVVSTPHLNGKHTIFGKVVKGMEIVNKIVKVERLPGDQPKETVFLKSVKIQ